MASHASALKAHRHSLRRHAINRANSTRLRSQIKRLRQTVAAGETAAAQKMLPETLSLIDKSIRKKVLRGNAAARQKSRLTRLVSGASKASSK